MFERKLLTLQYDRPSINVDDDSEFQNIVYWIESMKIRRYPPDDRASLLAGSKNWSDSYRKYLDAINYKGPANDRKLQLDFILDIALRYEMEDLRSQMQMSPMDISNLYNHHEQQQHMNEYDNLDVNSNEFQNELRKLAKLLNIPYYEQEPLITLHAITLLLRKLRKQSRLDQQPMDIDDNDDNNGRDIKKQKMAPKVEETILNMRYSQKSKYDPIVNRCANVIRLLYIKDLRELQTEINDAIVHVQSMTANPKTDSSLGQVGR